MFHVIIVFINSYWRFFFSLFCMLTSLKQHMFILVMTLPWCRRQVSIMSEIWLLEFIRSRHRVDIMDTVMLHNPANGLKKEEF